ncbi:MAG: hypothetical protein HQL46_10950 [Gammaproteobacteria bacterium]|nr:hypothetical protein [Gammaproteobacteria bacterium]
MEKNIYFPSFGTSCGFSNSAFQFLFMEHLKKLFPVNIYLGQFQNGQLPTAALFPVELFEIYNYGQEIQPDARANELSLDRLDGFNNDIATINGFVNGTDFQTLEISGYFQYHTALINSCGLRETFNETFGTSGEESTMNKFQKLLNGNQQAIGDFFQEKTLIVCHIRLGDYKVWEVHDKGGLFFTNDIPSLVDNIKDFIAFNYIQNAEVYIASDNPEECIPIFSEKGLNPLSVNSFFPDLDIHSGTALMFDLSVLSMADVFYGSNSSFSVFGSMLNQKQVQCYRPSPVDKSMVGFMPWNTQVLYKQCDTYPCSQ